MKSKFAIICGLLGGLSTPVLAQQSLTSVDMNPSSFADNGRKAPESDRLVTYVEHRGDGCPHNSVYVSESRDKDRVTIDYSRMDMDVDDRRRFDEKNCNVALHLDIPRGWQASFYSVNQIGYALAQDRDSIGSVRIAARTDYARSGVRLTNRRQEGPFNSNYNFTDTLQSRYTQWTECHARDNHIDISTVFTAEAKGPSSRFIFEGYNRRDTTQVWSVAWRRCDGGGNDPHPPSQWRGQCKVVLETLWGSDISDHWGYGYARSERGAVDAARGDALNRCERARNGGDALKCSVVESQCTARREN